MQASRPLACPPETARPHDRATHYSLSVVSNVPCASDDREAAYLRDGGVEAVWRPLQLVGVAVRPRSPLVDVPHAKMRRPLTLPIARHPVVPKRHMRLIRDVFRLPHAEAHCERQAHGARVVTGSRDWAWRAVICLRDNTSRQGRQQG